MITNPITSSNLESKSVNTWLSLITILAPTAEVAPRTPPITAFEEKIG